MVITCVVYKNSLFVVMNTKVTKRHLNISECRVSFTTCFYCSCLSSLASLILNNMNIFEWIDDFYFLYLNK